MVPIVREPIRIGSRVLVGSENTRARVPAVETIKDNAIAVKGNAARREKNSPRLLVVVHGSSLLPLSTLQEKHSTNTQDNARNILAYFKPFQRLNRRYAPNHSPQAITMP